MKIVIPIIAMSALIASGVSAWSGSSSTGSLQIKMKIDKTCTVNPGGDAVLDFGEYGVLPAASAINHETSIKVQCTNNVPYKIGLDSGKNSVVPNSSIHRRMKSGSGSNYIGYHLFSDEKRATHWGNNFDEVVKSNSGNSAAISKTADGTTQPHQIYGNISRFHHVEDAPPGTYTDTVTVTVQF